MERKNATGTQDITPQKNVKDSRGFSVGEAGQLSIFLGMALLVVITFIAFVVNVGLFVKAKINLQNSVDAAAYAGASVQARQLTNIGYLNWEIRNTYKEWLFKYYVLGNIGLDAIDNISGNEPSASGGCPSGFPLNPGNTMNFRLRQFKGGDCRYYKSDVYDRYNVPSICIHFGSNNNICEIVTLPGLPRFNTVGLPSISEQHESFLNNIVATKADDCSDRSNINQGAAMLWTYGTGNANIFPGVPEIASDRIGAWVQSLELAMRMRNLESIVNTPPQEEPVCFSANGAGVPCVEISTIAASGSSFPFQERISKSFWSAFRNLSGGAFKEQGAGEDFAASFRLREIPPTPFEAPENSLSGFLIPTATSSEFNAFQKYYLDLKVMPINYAIFYTSFFPRTDDSFSTSAATVEAEASCGGTKTALPVPGYILGFIKNPEVVTYYAVEGEAEFTGLFYPFVDRDGITLKTYAAAKPFGGRIGPALFNAGFNSGNDTVASTRDDKTISANYISAFNTLGIASLTTAEKLSGGYPVPTTESFWVSGTSSAVVGGNPLVNSDTSFGIPNLIYDFSSYSDIQNLGFNTARPVNVLEDAPNDSQAYQGPLREAGYGLYDIAQFSLFKDNRTTGGGSILSNAEIQTTINNVRRPTRYEALNYLLPMMDETGANPLNLDHNAYVYPLNPIGSGTGSDPNVRIYRLYAPLFGPDLLYNSPAAITSVIEGYINQNQSAVDAYTNALKEVADGMRTLSTSSRGGDAYVTAANTIYPASGNLIVTKPPGDADCDNLAMAQKFAMFFTTGTSGCGITPLATHTTTYLTDAVSDPARQSFQFYYTSTWKEPTFGNTISGFSGFKPGPRQGADDAGNIGSPFTGGTFLAKRNFYSSKFIPIKQVLSGGDNLVSSFLPIFGEPVTDNVDTMETSGMFASGALPMRNTIDTDELRAYGSTPAF